MDEEKKVEETTEVAQPEVAQEEVKAEEVAAEQPEIVKELAKEIAKMIPEHTTIQKVENGFIISIPGQKHRIANTLDEVIEQITDIFTV